MDLRLGIASDARYSSRYRGRVAKPCAPTCGPPATLMVVIIVSLFIVTYQLDVQAATANLALPAWVTSGGSDVARQILIAIAAAVITVAGVVFSITILVLQLAFQQFGPRMLRKFIRDTGTQVSLGIFVATFVYSVRSTSQHDHCGWPGARRPQRTDLLHRSRGRLDSTHYRCLGHRQRHSRSCRLMNGSRCGPATIAIAWTS